MRTVFVRVKRGLDGWDHVRSYEVQARRWWQTEWTILRVYTNKSNAKADAMLTRRRGFDDSEKELMKGAK
jgi:hypothetical protein